MIAIEWLSCTYCLAPYVRLWERYSKIDTNKAIKRNEVRNADNTIHIQYIQYIYNTYTIQIIIYNDIKSWEMRHLKIIYPYKSAIENIGYIYE